MSVQQLGQFPGEWCDVDWSPWDRCFVFAYLQRPGAVVLRRVFEGNTEQVDAIDLGRWGLYLRCAADGAGNVLCVLQDWRDRNPATGQFYSAIVVLFPKDGPPREIPCPAGPAFGQNAVEVTRWEGVEAFFVRVVTSPTTFWQGTLNSSGVWVWQLARTWDATSQGFADGDDRMDDVRASVPGMVCPSTADGLSIGQWGDPDRIRGLHQGVYFTVFPGVAFEPHVVSDGAGTWLACARTPEGAKLARLVPPFEAEQVVPIPQPPEPPPPDVPDPPPPTGETGMQLPENVRAIRARYVARFPVPQGDPGEAIEEAARQWSRNFSQQVRFETGDARWGMKNAGGGRPTSKDTIAYDLGDGRIRIWDLISAVGTGQGRLVEDPRSEDITGQVFEPQPPVDHLGVGQPQEPDQPGPTDPPPPTGTDLAAVHAKLDAILAELKRPIAILRA